MGPRDVGRIVIIDGRLSQERTTAALYITLDMLITRSVWTSGTALIASQVVVAGCCWMGGCPTHAVLGITLLSGVIGVAVRGALAWSSARKWRETVSDEP
jgi:NADH:ubiquinone oxidoreductase subunit 6 (subunit J)